MNFILHDTETTGLTDRAKIVEIGSVVVIEGKIVESFDALVNPGRDHLLPYTEDDLLPHNHIPVKDILAARNEESVAKDWNDWRAQWPEVEHTSYNIGFDSRFLRKAPWSLEEWGECVMLASAQHIGKIKWPKLIDMAERFAIQFTGSAHRALTDAEVAAKVYVEILRARSESRVF